MKKYEFTGETMQFEGRTLRRIRYNFDVNFVARKEEIGGWIEHEGNLSHEGTCSIRGDAKVFGNARITESADVFKNAIVKDNVLMKGNSCITGNAIVGGDTILDDHSWIVGNSKVFFYAQALDNNYGGPNLFGNTKIVGETIIEATGYIRDSEIKDISLNGHLVIDNENISKNI